MALIKKFHSIAFEMWQHRNATLHDDEDNFHHRRLHEEVNWAINQQFNKGVGNLLRTDKKLLKHKQALIKKPTMDKQRWLDRIKAARKAWKLYQDGMPNFDQERQGIRRFVIPLQGTN